MTNGKQSFDQEPDSKIEVNPGQDVILPCRIYQKSRNSICNWQKDGYPISLQTGKYQWDGDKQRGDCSLKIFKADINFDNGKINLFSFNTSNLKNYFRLHICMSLHLKVRHTSVQLQFLQSYHKIAPMKVAWYLLRDKNLPFVSSMT